MGTEATPDAAHNYMGEGSYSGLISISCGTDNVVHHCSAEDEFCHHTDPIGRGNLSNACYF